MPTLTVYIERDPETDLYVGIIPGVPGALPRCPPRTELREHLPRFVGVQQIDLA